MHLSIQAGGAKVYQEDDESRKARDLLALRLKLEPAITYEGKDPVSGACRTMPPRC